MNNKVKLVIFVATVFLILIIGFVALLQDKPPDETKQTGNQSVPTPAATNVRPTNSPATDAKLETIMKQQLPIQNSDVDIAYSRLLKKYYIYKKTPAADRIISNFVKRNQLESIFNPDRIVYTDSTALYVMFADEKRQFPNSPETSDGDI